MSLKMVWDEFCPICKRDIDHETDADCPEDYTCECGAVTSFDLEATLKMNTEGRRSKDG